MKHRHGLVLGLVLVLLSLGQLAAQSTPQMIKLQGFLSDTSGGSSVPAYGVFSMTFDLYNAEIGEVLVASVGPLAVNVTDGLYSVDLPFVSANFDGTERYIEITVDGESLSPRVRLVSAPFAYKADTLDGFEGGELDQSTDVTSLQAQVDDLSDQMNLEGNTLDQAYDQGGAGLGRTIIADAGPIEIVGVEGDGLTVDGEATVTALPGDNNALVGWNSNPGRAGVSGLSDNVGGVGGYFANTGGGIGLRVDGEEEVRGRVILKGEQSATLHRNSVGSDWFLTGLRDDLSHEDYVFHSYGGNWVFTTGGVGIGTSDLSNAKLHVRAVGGDSDAIGGHSDNPGRAGIGGVSSNAAGFGGYFSNTGGGTALKVDGQTTTRVLQIIGGADLAEPFAMSATGPIPKGAVVVIDQDNPGHLAISQIPYDSRVAGIVSGAGGVQPGITLGQRDELGDGPLVAMAGRVYCQATASNGPIRPGDLLTTSETPGHAMRATRPKRSRGAVIGKAMTALDNGEGLILVLVNLQ